MSADGVRATPPELLVLRQPIEHAAVDFQMRPQKLARRQRHPLRQRNILVLRRAEQLDAKRSVVLPVFSMKCGIDLGT